MGETYISCPTEKGSIHISEDVVSNIVRSAIAEVEGVAGFSNTAGAELAELVGLKTVPKGVKVRFDEDTIYVDAIITVHYGSNIMTVGKIVQETVLSAVQSTTGIEKTMVNVHVSGIAFDR